MHNGYSRRRQRYLLVYLWFCDSEPWLFMCAYDGKTHTPSYELIWAAGLLEVLKDILIYWKGTRIFANSNVGFIYVEGIFFCNPCIILSCE
jgi:hypothetical protein